MNKLPVAERAQIRNLLREGSSMRSISGVVDVSINMVTKADAGEAGAARPWRHGKAHPLR